MTWFCGVNLANSSVVQFWRQEQIPSQERLSELGVRVEALPVASPTDLPPLTYPGPPPAPASDRYVWRDGAIVVEAI